MATILKEFGYYNPRRYGRPWGANISFKNNKPEYDFNGHWDKKQVVLEADIGDVVAFGQKDLRGSKTEKAFYKVNDDLSVTEIEEHEAREIWNAKQAAPTPVPTVPATATVEDVLKQATTEQLMAELQRRMK